MLGFLGNFPISHFRAECFLLLETVDESSAEHVWKGPGMGGKEGWMLLQGTWCCHKVSGESKSLEIQHNVTTSWKWGVATTSATRNFRISKNCLWRGMPSFYRKQREGAGKSHHKFILSGSCLQPEWYISQSINNGAPTTDFALVSNTNPTFLVFFSLTGSLLFFTLLFLIAHFPIPNLANGLQIQTLWHPKQAHKSEMPFDRILRTSCALWGVKMSFCS